MRTIIRVTYWTKNEKRLFVTFEGEKEQGIYSFDKKSFSNITKEEANMALSIIKSAKNNYAYEQNCEAYYKTGSAIVLRNSTESNFKSKISDEEDLDRASQRVFKSTPNTDFSYEG